MKRGGPLALAILLVGAGIGVAFLLLRPAAKPSERSPTPAAAASPAPATLSLPGKIAAQHTIPVGVVVSGQIDALLADVGQDVFEGQVIARLSSGGLDTAKETATSAAEAAQSRVNSLETALTEAKLEAAKTDADAKRAGDQADRTDRAFKRQQELNREGATPRLIYEKAQREYETGQENYRTIGNLARAAAERITSLSKELEAAKRTAADKSQQLEMAQTGLAAAEVHAPANGLVVARKGQVGQQIDPEQSRDLFQIAVDLSLLKAVFDVSPDLKDRVKAGMPVQITVPELQAEAFSSVIKQVEDSQATAEFTSRNPAIRPGMNCGVVLQLK